VKSSPDEVDMGWFTEGVAEVLRVTFRSEELPPPSAPPRPAPAASRRSLARLLAPEPLPPPPPQAAAAPRARGPLSLLFAAEPLPPDLPPARRQGGRWLNWLLSPESLEP
jgi:hypothetical protein